MPPPECAARFAETYVRLLNCSLLSLATEEPSEVTKAILADAVEAYRLVGGEPEQVTGHAHRSRKFFQANIPDFEFIPAHAQAYDLFIQGGWFSLVLESELDPRKQEIRKDYNKLLIEEFAGAEPVRVIVLRNTRRDQAWRDNRYVHPLIDSWRTQQSFIIVELCWTDGAFAHEAFARARVHTNGATIFNTEAKDWAFRLTANIEPFEIRLPSGQHMTVQRTYTPSFDRPE